MNIADFKASLSSCNYEQIKFINDRLDKYLNQLFLPKIQQEILKQQVKRELEARQGGKK